VPNCLPNHGGASGNPNRYILMYIVCLISYKLYRFVEAVISIFQYTVFISYCLLPRFAEDVLILSRQLGSSACIVYYRYFKSPDKFHVFHSISISMSYPDLYQITMAYAYWKSGRSNDSAVFDLFFRKNPFQGEFTLFAGLEECLKFLHNFCYSAHGVFALYIIVEN